MPCGPRHILMLSTHALRLLFKCRRSHLRKERMFHPLNEAIRRLFISVPFCSATCRATTIIIHIWDEGSRVVLLSHLWQIVIAKVRQILCIAHNDRFLIEEVITFTICLRGLHHRNHFMLFIIVCLCARTSSSWDTCIVLEVIFWICDITVVPPTPLATSAILHIDVQPERFLLFESHCYNFWSILFSLKAILLWEPLRAVQVW